LPLISMSPLESVRRLDAPGDIDVGVKEGLSSIEQAEVVRLPRDNRRLAMDWWPHQID
jgi:hypothetical protein